MELALRKRMVEHEDMQKKLNAKLSVAERKAAQLETEVEQLRKEKSSSQRAAAHHRDELARKEAELKKTSRSLSALQVRRCFSGCIRTVS